MRALIVRRMSGLGRLALFPVAALAVHELRYLLAYGTAAGAVLQRTGHSYLHSLAPWLVALLAIAAGAFLRAFGRALSGQRTLGRYTISFGALWLACAVALVAIFAAQELLEGMLMTGHPAGLAGIFGYGGWWAVPAAACIGLVLAALLHGARWALEAVARRMSAPPRRWSSLRLAPVRCHHRALVPCQPLADGWSGRGPPR